jgi:large conductance mechanosensitive channel
MKKFFAEFKKFAMRGSVVDLAVGVVIGGAFGKIVTSFVNDILMPPIGVILGGVDFTELSLVIKKAVMKNGVVVQDAITLNYGNFIQAIIDFAIITLAIFMVVKAMNKMEKKKKEQLKKPSEEVKLLTEIRDSLKNN